MITLDGIIDFPLAQRLRSDEFGVGRSENYPLIRSETLPSVPLGIHSADSRHVDDVTNTVAAL